MTAFCQHFTSQGIYFCQAVDFIAKHFDTDNGIIISSRHDFYRIAVYAKCAAFQVHIVARVLNIDEFVQNLFLRFFLPHPQRYDQFAVVFRIAQSVNTGYGRNNNDIAPFKKTHRRRVAQFVDFIINRRIFFNIRIRRSNICFRLVIIIVADKICHFIVRKKRFKFTAKLRRQRLVVRDDKGRLLYGFYDFGHRKRFPCSCRSQQYLCPLPGLYAVCQRPNGFRLVAHRFIRRNDAERMRCIVIFT